MRAGAGRLTPGLGEDVKTPAETGAMVAEALTFADEPGGDPYQHDELIWADDTPDGKQSMAVWHRELGGCGCGQPGRAICGG